MHRCHAGDYGARVNASRLTRVASKQLDGDNPFAWLARVGELGCGEPMSGSGLEEMRFALLVVVAREPRFALTARLVDFWRGEGGCSLAATLSWTV